jgi:ribosome-binding protein aMBF1 (putative translation factor)
LRESDTITVGSDRDGNGTGLGLRIARARQEAGLSEKELANRLGLSLWRIQRIQSGDDDPRDHLAEIAEMTGKPTRWFLAVGEQGHSSASGDGTSIKGRAARAGKRLRTATRDLTIRFGHLARARDRSGVSESEEATHTDGDMRPQVAARIVRARQETQMSQKELGKLLDLPIWRIERIEHGHEDPAGYLQAIATKTGRDAEWFVEPLNGAAPTPRLEHSDTQTTSEESPSRQERLARPTRRNVVMASLVLLVTIRFFTEVVHLLPRPVKLVDIPVLILLLGVAAAVPRAQARDQNAFRYLAPGGIFLLIALVSFMANLNRVATGPTILFLYGFLAPLGVYVAVYQLWPTGNTLTMSRLLVGLAVTQLVVVGVIDLPLFLASHNPDKISGTFGENAYQLVIFLLAAAALVAGVYTFEKKRPAARLAPFFFAAMVMTIILAQYRAILLTMVTTALLIAVLLGFIKLRGAVASVLIAVTFAFSLSYVSALYPELKYASTVATLTSDPGLYLSKRLGIVGSVVKLYNDNPRYIVTGTGPGTFSSRAWYLFQPSARSQKGLGVKTASTKNGYQTDVSNKYVQPRLQTATAESVGGSYAVTSPFSSYTSLLAEVGLIGFVVMVSIYGGAFLHATRMTIRALKRPSPQDPLPGLLLCCTAGFFVLLQMAILENWWEVTRLTFIFWAVLAVATKEFSARYGSEALKSNSASSGAPAALPAGTGAPNRS